MSKKLLTEQETSYKRLNSKEEKCHYLEKVKNDLMEENESLKQEIESKNNEIKELKEKINPYEIRDPGLEDNNIGAALVISIRRAKCGEKVLEYGHAEEDEVLLEETFEKTGFRLLQNMVNASKKDINDSIEKLKEDIKKEDQLFICFINAHGGSNEQGEYFLDCDGENVYVDQVCTEIAKCKKLEGKPKLVVINACRGVKEDVIAKSERASLSDFLVLYSTAPKHKALCLEAQRGRLVNFVDEESNVFVTVFCNALAEWGSGLDLEASFRKNVLEYMQTNRQTVMTNRDGNSVRQCPFLSSLSLKGPIIKVKTVQHNIVSDSSSS